MKKKFSMILVSTTLTAALLMGCGSDAKTTAQVPEAPSDTAVVEDSKEPQESAATDTEGVVRNISIASISPSEANNARFIQGIQEKAKELGWTVDVTDAHGSADEANAAFQNFVSKKTDFIVDMVFPTTSLAAGLNAAREALIPVGTWGGGMDAGVYVTNGSGGPHAIPIVKQMCEDMGGKGEILALTYHTGQVAREREAEFDKILAEYPDIKVTKNEVRIPGYLQDGAQYANAWLAGRPEGEKQYAIWGSWDDPAIGAISSLKQMNRKDVKVYGQNGNADAILAIKDGWMTATAWQDSYTEGVKMVEIFEQIVNTEGEWEPIAAEVEPVIINAESVEAFIKEYPESIENVGAE